MFALDAISFLEDPISLRKLATSNELKVLRRDFDMILDSPPVSKQIKSR